MKVVYVLNSTLSSGGATKSFYNMLNGLMTKGLEPAVVVPDGNDFCATLKNQGIKTIVLNYRQAIYPPIRNIKEFLLFLPKLIAKMVINQVAVRNLCKEAKNFGAEMIHTNVSVVNIGMKAAEKLGIPHITHIREYGDKDFNMHVIPSRRLYLRNFTKKKSYTICITKDISRYYLLDNQANSRVIYNGVLGASDAVFYEKKDNYFLFAGRLEENKGIADVIKTYGKLCHERDEVFPLLIAGDGSNKSYVDSLHNLACSIGIADKIKFLGNRNDVFGLMSKAAAIIIPSHHEGFGRVAAEAMFAGCLVIGNDIAGTKEQFDNGLQKTGEEIGLRYHDDTELVKCLCDIMNNDIEPYFPMIKRAQKTVLSLYLSEQNSENIFDFYKNILER